MQVYKDDKNSFIPDNAHLRSQSMPQNPRNFDRNNPQKARPTAILENKTSENAIWQMPICGIRGESIDGTKCPTEEVFVSALKYIKDLAIR